MSEGWVRIPFLEYKNRGYFLLGLYTIYGISYLNLGFPSGLFPVVVDKESRLYPLPRRESCFYPVCRSIEYDTGVHLGR